MASCLLFRGTAEGRPYGVFRKIMKHELLKLGFGWLVVELLASRTRSILNRKS